MVPVPLMLIAFLSRRRHSGFNALLSWNDGRRTYHRSILHMGAVVAPDRLRPVPDRWHVGATNQLIGQNELTVKMSG